MVRLMPRLTAWVCALTSPNPASSVHGCLRVSLVRCRSLFRSCLPSILACPFKSASPMSIWLLPSANVLPRPSSQTEPFLLIGLLLVLCAFACLTLWLLRPSDGLCVFSLSPSVTCTNCGYITARSSPGCLEGEPIPLGLMFSALLPCVMLSSFG